MTGDALKLLDTVGEFYRQTNLALFPRAVLVALRKVIPCDLVSYNEISLRSQTVNFVAEPASYEAMMRQVEPAFWQWRHQHPLAPFTAPGYTSPARSIGEYLSPKALHKLEIYHEFLAPIGIEDTMMISLMTTSASNIFLSFSRRKDAFRARERRLLDRLGPHLVQAFDNAYTFTESKALAMLARGVLEATSYGLLLLDANLQIVHRNDEARALLTRCFQVGDSLLPAPLIRWLQRPVKLAAPMAPLEAWLPEGGCVVFRASRTEDDGWLIAAQEKPENTAHQLQQRFGLTPREADVLHWVKQGKSNPEIGTILGISPRTIDKHMERVLQKLEVDSRAAAIVMALTS